MTCPRCKRRSDGTFCRQCGLWHDGNAPICSCDRLHAAAALCVVCYTPVCSSCGVVEAGRSFCNDRSHATIASTHTAVARLASEFEADWLKANLAMAGVESVTFAILDHPGMLGCSVSQEATVYVRTERADDARAIAQQMEVESL